MKTVLSSNQIELQAQAYLDYGGSFDAWCASKDFWPGDVARIREYLRGVSK